MKDVHPLSRLGFAALSRHTRDTEWVEQKQTFPRIDLSPRLELTLSVVGEIEEDIPEPE